MRPPRWPTLTPPPVPRDIHEFKLPLVPTFLCAETPDQEENRRRLVRREAHRFYQMVAEHLGEEDARKLFCLFISNPRRGSPGGPLDTELRQRLLAEYDERCANALRYKSQGAKNIKARLARHLAPELGKKPDTVRKALDRFLAERTKHIEKQQRRRALSETRHGPRPKSTEDSDTKLEK